MGEPKEFAFMETSHKQVVLQFFKDHPDERFTTKELSSELELPASSLSRSLNDLANMGFLDTEKEGRQKFYSMDDEMRRRMDETFEDLQRARTYALQRRREKIDEELEEQG